MSYQYNNSLNPQESVLKKQIRPERADDKTAHQYIDPMLGLQATIGNQAVQNIAGSTETAASQKSNTSISIQRLQRLESEPEISNSLESEDFSDRLEKASQGGGTIDNKILPQLERGLGSGLSGVRVHTDAEADRLTNEMNAVAFATGQHIYFGSGMYNPDTPEGLWLLAHEAAHTLQQTTGSLEGNENSEDVMVSDPSDSFEQAADSAADRVLSGEATSSSSSTDTSMGSSTTVVAREEDNDWWGLAGGLLGEVPKYLGAAAGTAGLVGAEGAGGAAAATFGSTAAASSAGVLAPLAAVLGAGALGYGTGTLIAENTQVDEELGDAMFDVLGPGPGLWLADTFGL